MRYEEIIGEGQQSLWGDDELPKTKNPNRNKKLAQVGGIQKTYPNWNDGPKVQPIDGPNEPVNIDYETTKRVGKKGIGSFPFDSYSEKGLQSLGKPFEIKENPLNFIRTLKKQCEEPNSRSENNGNIYSCILNPIDKRYNAVGVRTKTNDIVVRFAVSDSNRIPNNLRIINPSDSESKESMISELKNSLKNFDSLFEKVGFDGAQSTIVFKDATPEDKLAVFWKVVDTVESMGPDFVKKESRGGGAGALISGSMAPEQYYKWLALNIYNSVKNNYSWGFSRGGGSDSGEGAYDKFDNLIVIGITPGGIKQIQSGRKAYREHVVPCDLINRMAIKLCQDSMKKNLSHRKIIFGIMELIHRNLAIVLCSSPPRDANNKPIPDPNNPTEQEIIDSKYQTTMPDGWEDGMNILERFKKSGIPVYKNRPGDPDHGKQISE
jgi:hypothetical protein